MNSKIIKLVVLFFILLVNSLPISAGNKELHLIHMPNDETIRMDPHRGFEKFHSDIANHIYDTLLDTDTENNIIPRVAKSYKRIDALTVEFTLRQDIYFHNGEKLDAAAVKYSLERIINPETKSPVARMFQSLKEVKIINRYKIHVITKYPDSLLLVTLANFGEIVPSQYLEKIGAQRFEQKPIGSGPFKLNQWEKGKFLILDANTNYWKKGAVKIDRVKFTFESIDDRVKLLNQNKVDMITQVKPLRTLAVAKNRENKIIKKDVCLIYGMLVNTKKRGPLRYKKVRQALNYAINLKKIIKFATKGNSREIAMFSSVGEIGHHPKLKPYPYDLKKAKKLLREAGLEKGFTIKVGFSPSTGGVNGPFAKIFRTQLQELGLTVTAIEMGTVKDVLHKLMAGQIPDIDIGISATPNPLGHMLFNAAILYYSKGPFSLLHDPQFDRLYEKAVSTTDEKEHLKLCYQLQQYFHDEVLSLKTLQLKGIYAMKKNIDYKPKMNGMLDLTNLEMKNP